MEKIKSIENVLDNMDKDIVSKVKKSVVPNILLLAVGIAFCIIHSLYEWESTSIWSPLLISMGSVCIIWGAFAFLLRKSHYISTESRQQLKKHEVYFQSSERDKLIRIMESGKLKELQSLKPSISDGLKLRVMATKDYQLCFSQVIGYEINEHVNINEVQKHSTTDALLLVEFLTHRGSK